MQYLKYFLILAAIGLGVGYYMYNKPHQNMERAAADVELTAEQLFANFSNDEATANENYLDQVIAVTGTVRDFSRNEEGQMTVTLDAGDDMFGVICKMDELSEQPRDNFQVGETITLKGLCTGMLMDVVLVRCVEI